ncbi:TIR domain-containing protein [Sphingomonas canadensis]|uniref:TIR domain-containing protein n=1 Tax=Sphingomonas canadensis TaxID=1219257 RepID=A0ABW3HAW6_9SPHN|nr:toll/interleukin-1 receptor domain-containing protein [Sphingomonas canadensis]MCW3836154.1 toll/interleukin-1 receptor domain-containing protein [Sphingomonas canadensis]
MPEPIFRAFVSYCHADRPFAARLQRRLETYRLPRRLAERVMPLPGQPRGRIGPVFRDREDLSAAQDLTAAVRAAIAASSALVVVASPDAVRSHWVALEIALFRALHPDAPVLVALARGEPAEALPPALAENGVEPLAADFRREGDGGRLAFLKIVAALAGLPLDALVQRDAQRQVRRVTAVTLGAGAVMLAMAVLLVVAVRARGEAERQRAGAEGLVGYMLTDLRAKLRGVGRLDVLEGANREALAYYNARDPASLSDGARAMRARILLAIGEDVVAVATDGDTDKELLDRAIGPISEAFRMTEALLAEAPADPGRVFDHAQSRYWMAYLAELRGHGDTALAGFRAYMADAQLLNRLAPGKPDYLAELGYAHSNLGRLALLGARQPQKARADFMIALRYLEQASRLEPKRDLWLDEIADKHAWIADSWFAEKRFAEARAERQIDRALKLAQYQRHRGDLSRRYKLVVAGRALARIDISEGKLLDAERGLEEVRDALATLRSFDPANVVWQEQAVRVETDFAALYQKMGRTAQARAALEAARKLLLGAPDAGRRKSIREPMEKRLEKLAGELNVRWNP